MLVIVVFVSCFVFSVVLVCSRCQFTMLVETVLIDRSIDSKRKQNTTFGVANQTIRELGCPLYLVFCSLAAVCPLCSCIAGFDWFIACMLDQVRCDWSKLVSLVLCYRRMTKPQNCYFLFYSLFVYIVVCKDNEREAKSGMCKSWAKSGYCKNHKYVMSLYCPKECKYCSKLLFTSKDTVLFPMCHSLEFAASRPSSLLTGEGGREGGRGEGGCRHLVEAYFGSVLMRFSDLAPV